MKSGERIPARSRTEAGGVSVGPLQGQSNRDREVYSAGHPELDAATCVPIANSENLDRAGNTPTGVESQHQFVA